ncbi:MAG: dTMP kinase [Planctomycetota bacterium]|nr:dTMP kinase [Planctomycetota bacterium]
MTAKFWVFEGMDGAGKSTQAGLLFDKLASEGRNPIHVREPGTTTLGESLRNMLLDANREDWHQRSEALLFFAARNELLRKQIAPALAAGRDVICDRFTPSTFAYQAKDDSDFDFIAGIHRLVVEDIAQPDGVIIFDCEPETSYQRVSEGEAPDGFENRGIDFQRKVRRNYQQFYARFPEITLVVDCEQRSIEDIHQQVAGWVESRRDD